MPHIHEKYDFVITAVIVYESKVLMVHHPRYDKWLFPGGHIELDENPEQAFYREVEEETGLRVELVNKAPDLNEQGHTSLPAPNHLDVHDANLPHKHIGLVYYCIAESNSAVLSTEHLDIRWLSSEDLDDPVYKLSGSLKFYGRDALATAREESA